MADDAFDRVTAHLEKYGPKVRVAPELRPDLERLARRVRIVRCNGGEAMMKAGFEIRLSPYMLCLLRLEGMLDE